MGADVHCFIEFGKNEDFPDCFSKVHFNRDYTLFGVMAGVRNEDLVLFHPKGLPKKISWRAESEYYLFVDKDSKPGEHLCDEHSCTKQRADEWIEQGLSTYKVKNTSFVTNPDWHSTSWLTTEEFAKVLNKLEYLHVHLDYPNSITPTLKATLAAMRELPNARLVFWFDN
jgi:hypothetical protein